MSAWSAAYFVYCLSGLGFLVFLILSVHKLMWLAYCGQSLLCMLYIAALDGDLARWLGLSDAQSQRAVLLSGVALLCYSFGLLSQLIQSDHKLVRWRGPLRLLSLLSLGLLALTPWVSFELMNTLVLSMLALALAGQVLPPLTWDFLPRTLRPTAMPVIVLGLLLLVVLLVLLNNAWSFSNSQALLLRRVAMVWVVTSGVVTMLYMTYMIEGVRKSAAARALAAARQEARANQALYESEREYRRVRELAAQRSELLSAASHDMRQPLLSLRATVDALSENHSNPLNEQAKQALDYVDQLASSMTHEAQNQDENPDQIRDDGTADATVATSLTGNATEVVAVQVFFSTLQQMFGTEAANRGVTVRVFPSAAEVQVAPLALMRVLSNLVVNAIRHAQCRTILLGVRRSGATLSLEVHDDGEGLNEVQLEQMQQPGQKSSLSGGDGLGLHIVRQLCAEHGYGFVPASRPGQGSLMRVQVPRAAPQS